MPVWQTVCTAKVERNGNFFTLSLLQREYMYKLFTSRIRILQQEQQSLLPHLNSYTSTITLYSRGQSMLGLNLRFTSPTYRTSSATRPELPAFPHAIYALPAFFQHWMTSFYEHRPSTTLTTYLNLFSTLYIPSGTTVAYPNTVLASTESS